MGHGEDYIQCIIREIKEEASIYATSNDLQFVSATHPSDDGSTYFSQLYLLRTDKIPQLSSEHTSGVWLSLEGLINKLEGGAYAKESLLPNTRLLRQYLAL